MNRPLLREWLPVGLRALCVIGVTPPALAKFLEYSSQVAQFETWGVPVPAVSVLVAGTVELFAVLALALGAAGRLGALALSVVMVVAIFTAGPNPLNVSILLAALGILALGTGRLSLWEPELAVVGRADR